MIILSDFDLQLIVEGTHDCVYEKLGAHVLNLNGSFGTHFAVWAPNAREISVVGDFNRWNPTANPLSRRGMTGVWSGFVGAIGHGAQYKYSIAGPDGGSRFDRADLCLRRRGTPRDGFEGVGSLGRRDPQQRRNDLWRQWPG